MVIFNVSLPICRVDETEARPQLILPRKLTLLSAITAVQVLFVFVFLYCINVISSYEEGKYSRSSCKRLPG